MTDPKLVEVIQETVWKVVSTNELAGVDGLRKETAVSPVTVEAFLKIKSLVLTQGDRQTYCDMYNDNPHYAFKDFDVFLDPDTGQGNINCDKQKSDFNYMVFRTEKSSCFDLRLNTSKPSERRVEILHGAKEAEVAPLFSSAWLSTTATPSHRPPSTQDEEARHRRISHRSPPWRQEAVNPAIASPTRSFTYKKTKQADLAIFIHYPPGWKETDKRPGHRVLLRRRLPIR